jgi:hypothetical protein
MSNKLSLLSTFQEIITAINECEGAPTLESLTIKMSDGTVVGTYTPTKKTTLVIPSYSGSGGGVIVNSDILVAKSVSEMDALKTDENVGKVVLYIGTSTDTYRKGARYLIENASSELGSFVLGESTLWAE